MNDPETPKNEHVLQTFKRELKVKLHPAEVAEQAKRLAMIETEFQAFIARKKALMAELNSEKARIEAERAKVAAKVTTEEELREVACTITAHFDRNVAVTTRNDTGETINERALEASERQVVMNMGDANAAAKSILEEARKPEQPGATEQHDNVVEMKKPAPCTAVTLGGVCTLHGSDCPNPETLAEREAKPKED